MLRLDVLFLKCDFMALSSYGAGSTPALLELRLLNLFKPFFYS